MYLHQLKLSKSGNVGLVKHVRQIILRCGTPNLFFPKKSFNKNGFVLIDSYRENEEEGFIVLNGH